MEVNFTCTNCNKLVTAPVECVTEEFRDALQVLSFCSNCGAFNHPLIPKK